MSLMVTELYDALRAAGVTDEAARAAARSVIAIEDRETLVTKADLRAEIAQLKEQLTWRMVLMMGAMTAIFSAISAALRFVRP
jgi:hypothetical protein